MNNIIVSTLRKGAIYVTERYQSVFSHTRRERHCVSFCNSNVECSVGHFTHHDIHRATSWHRRSHSYDLIIHLCEFQKGFSKDILITWWGVAFIANDSRSRCRIELTRCMPHRSLLFCRSVSLTFCGVKV